MIHVRCLSAVALVLVLCGIAAAAEPDKSLPDDTTLLVHVNIKQSLESPLGKKHITPLVQEQLKKNAELTQGLTALGFDPLRDFASLTLATSGIDSTEADKELAKLTIIAHGTFDLAKAHAAADAIIKQDPKKLSVTGQGDTRIYEGKNDLQTVYFAFVDKTTLVASGKRAHVVAAVKGGKTPKLNKDMAAVLAKVDGKQSVWFAALIPSEAKKALASMPQTEGIADKILSVSGGATLTKDFAGGLSIHTSDAKTAEAITTYLDSLKAAGKFALTQDTGLVQQIGADVVKTAADVVEGVQIGTSGGTASVTVKVTEASIQKMVKAAEALKP